MAVIRQITFPHFTWIHIHAFDAQAADQLSRDYGFHPLDLADCLNESKRSKIDSYDSYAFILLLLPVYNRQTREITRSELNIFISNRYLITIHRDNIPALNDFFNTLQLSESVRVAYQDKSPERLLYQMLNKVFLYIFPIIDHLVNDCDTIQKAIFSGQERKMVSEILIIRRNITDARKIMQAHKNVLKKTIAIFKDSPLYVLKKTDVYYESLVDYTKEIWDTLDNLKERIEALQTTNESQISFRLNDTMRVLTAISVATFPLALIASIFGMNVTMGMPLINQAQGFWWLMGIMFLTLLSITLFFKKKGWF